MHDEPAIRVAFRRQAGWCRNLGFPLAALVCGLAAERLDRSTGFGRRILDWPAQPGPAVDVLALRLAADWTEANIQSAPEPGLIRVLMRSVATPTFLQQPRRASPGTRPLRAARPRPRAPLAWLRFEPPGHAEAPRLCLQCWPGGHERALATGSPHGTWIRWG